MRDAGLADFQRFQRDFALHLRDPRTRPRPAGVPARRIRVYAGLLFNNVLGALEACYPVLRRTLGVRRFTGLARAFFATHRAQSPFYRQIPEEFLAWLQASPDVEAGLPPWTVELVHFEWIELALSVSGRMPARTFDPAGDLMAGVPVLNPVLANLRYSWPVHRIAPRRRIEAAETCILGWRDADDRVLFEVTNPATARLIALLEPGQHTGQAALDAMAAEMRYPDPAALQAYGAGLLDTLRARGAILGAALPGQ